MAHASKEGVTVADKEYLLGNKARELLKYTNQATKTVTEDISRKDVRQIFQKIAALDDIRDVQKLRRSEIQRIQTRVKCWEKAYPAGEVTREAVITSFVAWDAFASYGDTYALRLKYAKKVSVIIGVDVKPRRKINSTRSVRALRRVKQEQNIRRKRGDITPRKDLFQPEPRPDSIPPWM